MTERPSHRSRSFVLWMAKATILICTGAFQVVAQEQQQNYPVQFSVYEDRSAHVSDDVFTGDKFAEAFTNISGNSIRYDLTKSVLWIRFRLDGRSKENEIFFIQLSSPNLHHVTFFYPDSNGIYQTMKSGLLEKFHERLSGIDRISFPIHDNDSWHYLKIQTDHFLNTEIDVVTAPVLATESNNRIVFYSVYVGIMLSLVAYGLLFIYKGKEYHYLYYVGYILFISTINLTEKGFYFQFVWSSVPSLNYYFPLLPFGVSLCLLLFVQSIFHVDRFNKQLYNVSLWGVTILPALPASILLFLGKYQPALIITQFHSICFCVLILIINVKAHRTNIENRPFLKLIIVGLCFFASGVIVYLLSQNEILPINFITDNAIILGSLLEVCLFAASISFHQSSLGKKYQDLILNQNTELQRGILQRTLEVNAKNEMLQTSLAEKDNLLYIVAHDLKSPLNQTKALSSLVKLNDGITEDSRDLLNRIEAVSDHGLKLIEELGTVAQLESGQEAIVFEEINLNARLESTFKNYDALAKRKDISVKVQHKSLCTIITHAPYLVRIIENLMSNAIKFSPHGAHVYVTLEQHDLCEITISDQGPGFSEEDKKKLFRKFQRLSASPTAGEHSTGLGLYITKILAERIHAFLDLDSIPGKGSVFKIRFMQPQRAELDAV